MFIILTLILCAYTGFVRICINQDTTLNVVLR